MQDQFYKTEGAISCLSQDLDAMLFGNEVDSVERDDVPVSFNGDTVLYRSFTTNRTDAFVSGFEWTSPTGHTIRAMFDKPVLAATVLANEDGDVEDTERFTKDVAKAICAKLGKVNYGDSELGYLGA